MGTRTCDGDRDEDMPPLDLDALFREHIDAVRRTLFCRGLRGDDVDDVLQKVLLAAFRGIHTFDPASGELRAWLCGIARNEAARHRRAGARSKKRLSLDETPLEVPDERPDAEACLIEQNSRQELDALLLEIPPERREVVKAFALSAMPLKEVAESLLIPESTVKSRLKRARRRWCALPPAFLDAWNDRGVGPRAPRRPVSLLLPAESAKWVQHILTAGMVGSLLVLTPTAPAREAPPLLARPTAVETTTAVTEAQSAQPGRADRGRGAKGAENVASAAPAGSTRALQGARDDADEDERDLVHSAAAAMSARHWDVARWLLEEHRRRFPSGRHAGEREQLLRSLSGATAAPTIELRR
jgi:RNA polymerase sigma factor (sigma-70 family)